MNNIEELERSLPRRLREAAERMPLNPSDPVHARPSGLSDTWGPGACSLSVRQPPCWSSELPSSRRGTRSRSVSKHRGPM